MESNFTFQNTQFSQLSWDKILSLMSPHNGFYFFKLEIKLTASKIPRLYFTLDITNIWLHSYIRICTSFLLFNPLAAFGTNALQFTRWFAQLAEAELRERQESKQKGSCYTSLVTSVWYVCRLDLWENKSTWSTLLDCSACGAIAAQWATNVKIIGSSEDLIWSKWVKEKYWIFVTHWNIRC